MAGQKKTASRKGAPDEAHLDRAVEPEYAAVSIAAIAALVLAVVGLVAFKPSQPPLPLASRGWFQLPILLLIPVAAVAVALGSLRSIRRSEGTKAGQPLALAALVLALATAAGSTGFHAVRQYREHERMQSLVAASSYWLDLLLREHYRTVFDELVRSHPLDNGEAEKIFPGWEKRVRGYLFDGGDYYGRRLQDTNIAEPSEEELGTQVEWYRHHSESFGAIPSPPPYDAGVAIHRLKFKESGVDIPFVFWWVDGRWRLINVSPRPALVFPEPGEAPKKRFE